MLSGTQRLMYVQTKVHERKTNWDVSKRNLHTYALFYYSIPLLLLLLLCSFWEWRERNTFMLAEYRILILHTQSEWMNEYVEEIMMSMLMCMLNCFMICHFKLVAAACYSHNLQSFLLIYFICLLLVYKYIKTIVVVFN